MTLAGAIFAFVSVVTLSVTGFIAAIMVQDPARSLAKLDHAPEALPEVMAGRYLTFLALTVMAVLYRDFAVMAGLQAAFILASMVDVIIYARRGGRVAPHAMAAFASFVAFALCLYVVVTQGARPWG
ncbi:MAG: hypothetical protein AAFM92_06930 [Pseudomonadota bacterium]